MTAVRGLVIADDLSGANDTGDQLAARGYRTTVGADRKEAPATDDVLVVDTDSRYCEPEEAARRVTSVAERYPSPAVYKKVDSTLRGNLVAELTAVVEATGATLAVVAPAFPAAGRITVGGIQVVDGTPVARTEAGRDADKPVDDSHIPTLLADVPYELEAISLDGVSAGPAAVHDRLRSIARAHETAVVVCDAATDTHLDAIATAANRVDAAVTYAGSAGLAGHVRLGARSSDGILGIVGSANPRTFEQLGALADATVVELDARSTLENPDVAIPTAAERAVDALDEEGRAVVTAARSATDVESAIERGRSLGMTDAETRDAVAAALGRIARDVHESAGFDGLFATGGAVATAVLDALDGTGVRLTGHAVDDGVPIGRVTGGSADGIPVVTKAGAFGDPDTIFNSLRVLSRYDGSREAGRRDHDG